MPNEIYGAAMLDGAGPLRILISVILPQSVPVVTTVALLHFFYIWNETRLSSLYRGISPNLQMFPSGSSAASPFSSRPRLLWWGPGGDGCAGCRALPLTAILYAGYDRHTNREVDR